MPSSVSDYSSAIRPCPFRTLLSHGTPSPPALFPDFVRVINDLQSGRMRAPIRFGDRYHAWFFARLSPRLRSLLKAPSAAALRFWRWLWNRRQRFRLYSRQRHHSSSSCPLPIWSGSKPSGRATAKFTSSAPMCRRPTSSISKGRLALFEYLGRLPLSGPDNAEWFGIGNGPRRSSLAGVLHCSFRRRRHWAEFASEPAAFAEPNTVVVSEAFWKARLGGAADVIGQPLPLSTGKSIVVGVMPDRFDYPLGTEIWSPLMFTPAEQSNVQSITCCSLDFSSPMPPPAKRNPKPQPWARALPPQYPATNDGRSFDVIPIVDLTEGMTNRFVASFSVPPALCSCWPAPISPISSWRAR